MRGPALVRRCLATPCLERITAARVLLGAKRQRGLRVCVSFAGSHEPPVFLTREAGRDGAEPHGGVWQPLVFDNVSFTRRRQGGTFATHGRWSGVGQARRNGGPMESAGSSSSFTFVSSEGWMVERSASPLPLVRAQAIEEP
jgi:hypothetical protein